MSIYWTLVPVISTGLLIVTLLWVRTLLQRMRQNNQALLKANRQLEESRERYRLMFDNAPLGYQSLNENGDILDVNTVWIETLGYARQEVIGHWFGRFLHPDDRPVFQKRFSLATRSKTPLRNVEYRLLRKDGSEIYAEFTIQIGRHADGRFLQTHCVFQDLSGQKRAETAWQVSEARYKKLIDATDDIIWTMDLNLNTTYVSPSITARLGYSPEERCKQPVQEQLTSPSLEKAFTVLEREMEREKKRPSDPYTDRTITLEVQYLHKDGTPIWFENLISWQRDEKGDITGIHGVSRDITRRKEMEDRLMESEAFHREFFEYSPTAMFLQDFSGVEKRINALKDGGVGDVREYLLAHPDEVTALTESVKILRVNRAGLKLYRAASSEEVEHRFGSAMKPDDLQHFIDQVMCFLDGKDRYEAEALNRDFKGNTLEVMLRKVVINRKQNGLTRVLSSVVDVTDLHRVHREKRQLEKQLMQTRKLETIGTLAGGIAHDFNNILTPIIGYAEMLQEDLKARDPMRTAVDEILTSAVRARDLVRQILTFSRREEGQDRLIRVEPLLSQALKLIRATVPSTIEIHHETAPGCGPVHADPTQVHQMIMNILTNAWQSIATVGAIHVRLSDVTLEAADLPAPDMTPGRHLCLEVKDSGSGMEESVRQRIFEPFFTTKAPGSGTGMGLSVVHGVVTRLNGGMTVISERGRGSTFRVYLPVADASHLPESAPDSDGPLPRGSEHILVADDEPSVLELQRAILERQGYQVTALAGGEEALAWIKTHAQDVDLVITDLAMPRVPGDRLAREIRQLRPDLPVIMNTGYSHQMTQETMDEVGITALLQKPVGKKTLIKTVQRVLDESPVRQAMG